MSHNTNTAIRSIRRAGVLGVVLVVALLAVAAPVQARPGTGAQQVARLRAQVRSGTLLTDHGAAAVCAHCTATMATRTTASAQPLTSTTPLGYGAGDLARAYHLPAGVGAPGTVAVIEAGDYPNIESDLAVYRSQFGLPPCTTASGCLKVVNFQGGPAFAPDPTPTGQVEETEAGVEAAVDIQMASAACPRCHLLEVQIPLGDPFVDGPQSALDAAMADIGTAVDTAARLGAGAISMSFEFPSDLVVETGPTALALRHPGVAVLASAGDDGFEGNQHRGWPENLPWVVSVGGTSLFATNAAGTRFTQTAWSGTGSGCETDLPAAVGQPKPVSDLCGGHRAGSDVAAVADQATGVATFDTYAPATGVPFDWLVIGGTSVATPLVAGMYARGGHLAGVLGPNTLYAARKSAFTDVTVGQNAPTGTCPGISAPVSLCQAGPGWDGPTGVGAPDGLAAF
ncbi:MAG TPA: S8 family serine peptidase [Pseudonocardiaceae bacterium]|nr:S8 family serine peptidase [Pseudonocardiaceae bacterium]